MPLHDEEVFQMYKASLRILVVGLLVLAVASPVFATTSRVNSLAQTGDYLNDDSNIFRWYGVLPSYANLVMAELGTWNAGVSDQALGVTHTCGDNGKWGTFGLFLLQNSVTDNSFFVNTPTYMAALGLSDVFLSAPVNKFALMWGKEFESFSLGLSFTRSDVSTEDETVQQLNQATAKMSQSYTTFGAGTRADLGDKAYTDVAVTVGFMGYSQEGGALTAKQELDKKLSLDFAGRMFYEWKDNLTVVPMVDYGQYEYALKNAQDPHGGKAKYFAVGTGMNMDVNTNNLLICGAEIDYYKWEYSSPGTSKKADKMWSLPTFFLALESDVKPWMTTRIGAWKSLFKSTDTTTDPNNGNAEDYIMTGTDFAWFLGLGFHVAEFDIDMQIGGDTPFNLGYWLTGYSQYNGAPVNRISAIYHF